MLALEAALLCTNVMALSIKIDKRLLSEDTLDMVLLLLKGQVSSLIVPALDSSAHSTKKRKGASGKLDEEKEEAMNQEKFVLELSSGIVELLHSMCLLLKSINLEDSFLLQLSNVGYELMTLNCKLNSKAASSGRLVQL